MPEERNITVESGAFGAGLASRRASASATTGASSWALANRDVQMGNGWERSELVRVVAVFSCLCN